MARKRKVTKKDGRTALRDIVRPMSVVDIATRGGKPVTKKRISEKSKTSSSESFKGKTRGKRVTTKKDGVTYRLKYGEQINQDQKVSGQTALRDIVRPMSVVDIATRGGKPVTKKRIGEQSKTKSEEVFQGKTRRKRKIKKKSKK